MFLYDVTVVEDVVNSPTSSTEDVGCYNYIPLPLSEYGLYALLLQSAK